MPTVTESELKELKDLMIDLKVNQAQISGQILALDEKLTGKINALDEKLSGQITALDEKLSGQISVVDEKVTGLGKRLDFQEFVNRGFLIGVGVATLTALAKLLGLIPIINP